MNANTTQLPVPREAAGHEPPLESGPSAALPSESAALPEELAGGQHRDGQVGLKEMLRLGHRALRGRYALAITLALLGAALGASAGWHFRRPSYHSEALLQIKYALPAVMQETDQNQPLQMFDTFMQSQRVLITSRRVIDMAMQDPIWKATGRQLPDAPDRYFADHLDVEVKSRSEFILVTVHDEDPGTAETAVNAVVDAYTNLYDMQEQQLEHSRTDKLQEEQQVAEKRIDSLTNELNKSSKEFGTTNLSTFYDAAAARLIKLEAALADLRFAIATEPAMVPAAIPAPQPAAAAQAAGPTTKPLLTPELIAAKDPEMRRLLDEQSAVEAELQRLSLNWGPAHRSVIAARFSLDQAKARVQKRFTGFRDYEQITGQNLQEAGNARLAIVGKSRDQLRADEARLIELHDDARQETVRLGNKDTEFQQLKNAIQNERTKLAKLTERENALKTERTLGGRLNVVSRGQVPLSSDRDPRIRLAGAGGIAGFCLPLAAVVALGLVRRRYDFSEETEADVARSGPLLGILPDLEDVTDGERLHAAAQCVHRIRVLLRARARRQSCAYLITSATAGEGKTSLTVSLGLSFAASGLRTLVIDCDLIGRRLTSGFDALNKTGLREALSNGSIRSLLRRTHGGLYVLTAGNVRSTDAAALPGRMMANLLAEAQRYFEVILVDTGPILGSLEAAVLAPEVDGAVLTISRGQERGLVRTALQRLRAFGVPPAGFVYNRARPQDFDTSPYGSTPQSVTFSSPPLESAITTRESREDFRGPAGLSRFGPLVRAVAAGIA
jgi:Mrp family chromosome partitioning ATPase/uncharacterized protein involved in exopolysaccharide biosynthesis